MTEKLNPCPVCGKTPKIKRDLSYEFAGFGAWCIIQCKPLLCKPHLKVEEGKSTWNRALMYAINSWNVQTENEENEENEEKGRKRKERNDE